MIEPMLCQEVKDVPGVVPSVDNAVMEKKLDGWRFMFERAHGDDPVKSYAGRNGSDRTGEAGLRHIEYQLQQLPSDTVIDCELIAVGEGLSSGDVSTALAYPSSGSLQAVAFDIVTMLGEDVRDKPLWRRKQLLAAVIDAAEVDDGLVRVAEQYPASQELYEEWVADGGEGAVVKDLHSTYVSGRSWSWVKVKAFRTDEAMVTGFKEGKGSRLGKAGAFKVTMLDSGAETTVGTSTDAQREDIAAHPEKYLNKVIEVKSNGLGRTGKPRHPIFMRLREDRDAVEANQRAVVRDIPKDPPKDGSWLRNYAAMGEAKLAKCIRELEAGEGDAVRRVEAKGGDIERNLNAARDAANTKGVAV